MNDKYPTVKDPGIRKFLEEGEKLYPADAVNFSMEQQRAFYDQFCAHFDYPHPAGVTTLDFKVGEVSLATFTLSNGMIGFLSGWSLPDSVCRWQLLAPFQRRPSSCVHYPIRRTLRIA